MCGAFSSQSSFIFKWRFLPCSDAFAGYFRKMEILFSAFLFGCWWGFYVLFFLPCLLSWACEVAAAGTWRSMRTWCWSTRLHHTPAWHQEWLCKRELPGTAVYFLFSLLFHSIDPEKKLFFGQIAQLKLQQMPLSDVTRKDFPFHGLVLRETSYRPWCV